MSANQLERYKEQVKRNEVKKILNMVKGFSLGRNPQNSFVGYNLSDFYVANVTNKLHLCKYNV